MARDENEHTFMCKQEKVNLFISLLTRESSGICWGVETISFSLSLNQMRIDKTVPSVNWKSIKIFASRLGSLSDSIWNLKLCWNFPFLSQARLWTSETTELITIRMFLGSNWNLIHFGIRLSRPSWNPSIFSLIYQVFADTWQLTNLTLVRSGMNWWQSRVGAYYGACNEDIVHLKWIWGRTTSLQIEHYFEIAIIP